MATKIQVRRDTAADWTSNNPTLAAGEIGFESDTNKFKIGDGATAWTSLNYAPEGYATTSYVDTQDANIASDTLTFTNKTFDANGTGNSISNIETADIAAGTLVTAAEGIGSNDNDTTIPTSAAVKAYADSVGGGGASLGDLTAVGSTLSSPSNGTLALETSGTGKVVLAANNGDYESGLSSTRYNNSNNLFYEDTSETLDTGTQRYLNNMYGRVTLTSGQATSTNSNDRWLNQNLVRLDMNGNSSTNSSSTYRSRGPSALKNYTTVVNGGAGASTLGNATANLNGIYSYLNNQDLTITAATGVNSTLEFESDGTGDLNVTEWRAYQSFAEGYGSSGSLNITDFYHYYCDTPSGNITNQYAFYDATNSLSVFGDIQTQAISITDNTISTNRSNDNLQISANGTGRIDLSSNGTYLDQSTLYSANHGTSDRVLGLRASYDQSVDADTIAQRTYAHALHLGTTLTAGSSTNNNFRVRGAIVDSTVDLAGYSYTKSSFFNGPVGMQVGSYILNNSATNATIDTIRGVETSGGIADYNNNAGNITVNNSVGNGVQSYWGRYGASAGDMTISNYYGFFSRPEIDYNGAGSAAVTNAYHFYTGGMLDYGATAATKTNEYGFYVTGLSATNKYAFYDATNSLSVFGDIQTQAVSITDNKITTNRSNDDLLIGTNGTGRINISSDDSYFWGTNALYSNYFGTPDSIKTLGVSKTQTVDANAVSSQQNLVGFAQNTTLSGSSTSNSNFRFRTLNMANSMDMAGYSFTQASDSRGPWAASMVTNVCNSGLTASTLYAALGSQGVAAAYAETDFSDGDLTITHAIANQGYLELESAGSGAGSFTFTNGYNFRSKTYVNSGDTITNHYGFYHQAPTGGGTVTNQYAFYDASNSLSVFGDIQTQAVSITDNVISTNRSNDDLNIKTAGTGRINLSSAGNNQNDSTIWPDFWGSATNVKDFSVHRETSDDANTAARQYLASFANISTLTGGSTSNSNFRPRGVLQSAMVDMAGYSYTLSGDSRGPIGVTCIANAVNSSATASTLASMIGMDNAAGVYAYSSSLAAGNITVTDAKATKNSVYASNDGGGGAGVMTVTNGYGTWNRASVSGASDSITNMYGFYYHGKDGSGSITNEYAFYDASNSLSVFGDIQTQGVSITDNHIKSNRSNDNLNFETNGTGRFNFGDSQTFNVDWQSLYGADNRVTDLAFIKEESKDANTSGFEYMAGFHHDVQLTNGSTTNSNFRPRGILSLTTVDHAGYSYTRSGLFRGPLGAAFGALSMNSSATAATLANNRGLEIAHGAYTFNSATAQGDVTVTDSTGCMAISYAANDDTGTGADFNITNAYAFRAGYYVIGAASSITNHYGYYYHGDEYVGGTNPTNIYAFYDNANKLSRFGAVILANQASDPSGVADSAHIYAKDDAGSSEVYVRDEAGNVTKISPHNEAGEWEYYSRNSKTGKTVRINMEKLVAEVEKLSGKTFIENE